jgi:hypothetical protein
MQQRQQQWPDSHQSRGDGGMQVIASSNNSHTADSTAILRAGNRRWESERALKERVREASGFRARSLLGIRRARAGQKHEDGDGERAQQRQITECAGHGGGFAGQKGEVRGTHIIEYVMRCCNVGSIVLVLLSLYADLGRTRALVHLVGLPFTVYFPTLARRSLKKVPCQIGRLEVSCVLMLCLCRNYW